MRWLQLPWIWVILWVLWVRMSSSPGPSRSSSLPQRAERQIRQARQLANIAPYSSPRRHVANAPPLRVLAPRPNGDLESQRAVHRDADRERQLALQETPSRRRRRMPDCQAGDENRAPSPTPVARPRIEQPVFAGVGTPPNSQRPLPPDKRTVARRARSERERQERERLAAAAPPAQQPSNPTTGFAAVTQGA
ncbi:hypothetical protein B0H10DRAFT_1954253 [Mycena sp. CBHHK59/15]|nr:hypothetical protein B0H10DRAFT_1962437 [Mycena sp. CBHHK59/15]KAJ6609957.1 hypothetical protein B0H10DRAFT_1954253 [Mycena sp. CBHHK59/15]